MRDTELEIAVRHDNLLMETYINRHAVQNTSIEAFKRVKPILGRNQMKVLNLLRENHDLTNSEIANKLGWPINRVTPRVYELRQLGEVSEYKKRKCSITGLMVIAWGVNYRQDLF